MLASFISLSSVATNTGINLKVEIEGRARFIVTQVLVSLLRDQQARLFLFYSLSVLC